MRMQNLTVHGGHVGWGPTQRPQARAEGDVVPRVLRPGHIWAAHLAAQGPHDDGAGESERKHDGHHTHEHGGQVNICVCPYICCAACRDVCRNRVCSESFQTLQNRNREAEEAFFNKYYVELHMYVCLCVCVYVFVCMCMCVCMYVP